MIGPQWRRYLRFWRADAGADLNDEVQFHIESRVHEYVASGMTLDQARDEALRRFGDVERVRRVCNTIDRTHQHELRRAHMLDELRQDLRYAVRALRRNPGFTAIAALTLALGIGANTAIFSVVNGVLLHPLPYAEPGQLVSMFTSFSGSGDMRYSMSQPEFMDYKGLTRVFANAAAYTSASLTLTGDGEPERVRGMAATRDLFPVLGVVPLRGRNFENDEGRQGTAPVVILTYAFWRNRFGGRAEVLGSSLTLNGTSRQVVGILPPDVTLGRADAFIPIYINPDSLRGRSSNYLSGVARLRAGVTVAQAQRELDALTRQLNVKFARAYPKEMGFGATVIPMREEIVGDVKPALLILLGAVGLVLLIACANVANLLLARGAARQREMAVRLALGGSRGRIARQLLTESTVLALLGAAGGVLLAWWGVRALLAVNPDAIPRMELIRIDTTVGAVTLALALLTGLLFGLAPVMQLVRTNLQSSLKEGTRGGTAGTGHQRVGRALVMGEIALAVIVVIGAALLLRSFWALRNVDPGFDPRNVLAVDLSIPSSRYNPEATTVFYQQLVEKMAALPGVQVAAAASALPPVAGRYNWDVLIDGQPKTANQAAPSPNIRAVTRDYFRALSIRLVAGRLFGKEDARSTMPVAVVNETAARSLFDGADPIGKRVRFSSRLPWITIIGVARDVRSVGLGEAVPTELYLLHDQLPTAAGGSERAMYVVLRTAGDPLALAASARRVVRDQDQLLAITGIRSMTQMVHLSIARPRFTMLLLGVFGCVALTLAAIGIYGIMSYAVRRRTREIGVRMALGARPSDVVRMVVRQGMGLALLGLVAGVAGALLVTQLMSRLLFGVSATDPLSFIAIIVLLALVALVASWLPARRAVATNPTTALRAE